MFSVSRYTCHKCRTGGELKIFPIPVFGRGFRTYGEQMAELTEHPVVKTEGVYRLLGSPQNREAILWDWSCRNPSDFCRASQKIETRFFPLNSCDLLVGYMVSHSVILNNPEYQLRKSLNSTVENIRFEPGALARALVQSTLTN